MRSRGSNLLNNTKRILVAKGADSRLTRTFLRGFALTKGYKMHFGECVSVIHNDQVLRVSKAALYLVPYLLNYFPDYFSSLEPTEENGRKILDFSQAAFHRYRRTGQGFYFPSVPEEDFGQQYTKHYCPQAGEIVFDLGANAGATAYFLAQMVGPSGRVYAFEPDDCNYSYLLKNIEYHKLSNVVPIKKALGAHTGTQAFHMDGTLASGMADLVQYPTVGPVRTVETLTLADACRECNAMPTFIKMDVEGAEIAIVSECADFLKNHPIHFAIDSCHIVDGSMTYSALEKLFRGIGYDAQSTADSGSMFTWAWPARAR
jgi:FkbM family methyltransferase